MPTSILKSLTFTPDAGGRISVTISGEVQATGSATDWGSLATLSAFCLQSGAYVFGNYVKTATTRLPFIAQHSWEIDGGALVQGVPIEVGLYAAISGPAAITAWNVNIIVEHIKR